MSVVILEISAGVLIGVAAIIIAAYTLITVQKLSAVTSHALIHTVSDRLGLSNVPGCQCEECTYIRKTPKHLRVGQPKP